MSHQPPFRRLGRALVLVSAMLAAIGLLVIPAAAQPSANGSGKIEKSLAAALDAKGSADFYVEFSDQADLSAAAAIADWDQRGKAVVAALQRTAEASQSDVRKQLKLARTPYQPFWVGEHDPGPRRQRGAGRDPGVARQRHAAAVAADVRAAEARTRARPRRRSTPSSGASTAISADEVWSTFGVRGEGIVVANIDTGVAVRPPRARRQVPRQHRRRHVRPQLQLVRPVERLRQPVPGAVRQQRPRHAHDGHHGRRRRRRQPDRRRARRQVDRRQGLRDQQLLRRRAAGLRPVDPRADRPRRREPAARPAAEHRQQLVGRRRRRPLVPATRSTPGARPGIFPAFSNGNAGPGCDTAGSPGDYAERYAVGAFDINGAIAGVLQPRRRPTSGGIKPNIAAPGVNVRSSITGGGYAAFNGTSMASPHVAGTVALMWSAAPALVGDIAATRGAARPDRGRHQRPDLRRHRRRTTTSGARASSTPSPRSTQSPRGPVGTLSGTVTNAGTGAPIAGATVHRRRPGRPDRRPPGRRHATRSTLPSAATRSRCRRSASAPAAATVTDHRGRDHHAGLRADPGAERHASAARSSSGVRPGGQRHGDHRRHAHRAGDHRRGRRATRSRACRTAATR